MQQKLVSIITPSYNSARFIKQTIDSVLAQSYPHWEMLIVDDGSNDQSPSIIEEYSKQDERIRLIRQKNAGSASARNHALREAKGRYFCFLDADDLIDCNFLESQIRFIQSKKATIVYASYRRIDEKGTEILKPFIVPDKVNYTGLLKTCSISCLTAMVDRSITGDVFFDETLKSMRDDYAFWLFLLKKTDYAYGNKTILASYRVFSSSTTGNKKKVMKPQFLIYFKIEKLGIFKSIYYFAHWAINGFLKYK